MDETKKDIKHPATLAEAVENLVDELTKVMTIINESYGKGGSK